MATGIKAPKAVSTTAENWIVRDSIAFAPFFRQYQVIDLSASASTYLKSAWRVLSGSVLFQGKLAKGSDLMFLGSLEAALALFLSVICLGRIRRSIGESKGRRIVTQNSNNNSLSEWGSQMNFKIKSLP